MPLGQAAPYVAAFAGTGAVTDVLAPPAGISVSGSITDAKGMTKYSAEALAGAETDTGFLGALYHSPYSGSHFDTTFGTDSSLAVTPGWDAVTGWGTLNMEAIFALLAPTVK